MILVTSWSPGWSFIERFHCTHVACVATSFLFPSSHPEVAVVQWDLRICKDPLGLVECGLCR